MEGEIVGTHIKATENTTLVKLTVIDQIKMLVNHFTNNDAAELDAREKVSASELKMKASLNLLLNNAGKEMKERGSKSVTIAVSSAYLPYLDEAIDKNTGLGRYYNFKVYKKELPFNVNYNVIVRMSSKVSTINKGDFVDEKR